MNKTDKVPAVTVLNCVRVCAYTDVGVHRNRKLVHKQENFRVMNAINKIKRNNAITPTQAILEWMII